MPISKYQYTWNILQKKREKRERIKEIILAVLILLAFLIAFGLAGRSDLKTIQEINFERSALK